MVVWLLLARFVWVWGLVFCCVFGVCVFGFLGFSEFAYFVFLDLCSLIALNIYCWLDVCVWICMFCVFCVILVLLLIVGFDTWLFGLLILLWFGLLLVPWLL